MPQITYKFRIGSEDEYSGVLAVGRKYRFTSGAMTYEIDVKMMGFIDVTPEDDVIFQIDKVGVNKHGILLKMGDIEVYLHGEVKAGFKNGGIQILDGVDDIEEIKNEGDCNERT